MCNAAMEEGNPQVVLNNYAVFTYYVNTLTYRRKTDTDTAVKQVKFEANLQYIRCVGRQMKGNSCQQVMISLGGFALFTLTLSNLFIQVVI